MWIVPKSRPPHGHYPDMSLSGLHENLIWTKSQGFNCWVIGSGDLFFLFFFLIFFATSIYFWDRERQSMNGGGAEREGDTESETGSRL